MVVASRAGRHGDRGDRRERRPTRSSARVVEPAVGHARPSRPGRSPSRSGSTPAQVTRAVTTLLGCYRAFRDLDATMVEINPLVVTTDGQLLALDCKMTFDDNALFRRPNVSELRDYAEEDPRESQAAEYGLNYVALDGEIGCIVNGAGLAMAHDGHDQARRRLAGQLPRRGRRRLARAGLQRLPAGARRPQGRGDPGQHLRRHQPLRLGGAGRGASAVQGAQADGPAGGAARRHQRRGGPADPARRAGSTSSRRTRSPRRPRRSWPSSRPRAARPGMESHEHPHRRDGRASSSRASPATRRTFHGKEMIAYGTNLVGGVTPGKGGKRHLDRPVFNTVKEAVQAGGGRGEPSSSCRRRSAPTPSWRRRTRASGSICAITDGIPAQDMMMVKRYLLALSQGEAHHAHRPQLRRRHQPGQGDDRHHAGTHLHSAAPSAW